MKGSSLRGNIWKLYAISAIGGASLYYALDKVFMEMRGLTVSEIVAVEVVYAITVLVLEVPTGALADRWSRKYVLALNVVFFMLNTLIWIFSHDFSLFALGVLMGAIHSTLASGTFNSLLYDSLKELKEEGRAEKVLGLNAYYDGLLAVVAGVAGGFIANAAGIELTLWLTLITSLIGLLFCLSLKEPTVHRTTGEMGYWKHIGETAKYMARHPSLYHTVVLMMIFGLSYTLIDEYAQLYFFDVSSSLIALGLLAGGIYLLEALGGRFSTIAAQYRHGVTYLIVLLASVAGYVGLWAMRSPVGMGFALIPLLGFFLIRPLLQADLHHKLPSHYRATGESYASLLASLLFIPGGLAFGVIADKFNLPTAYLCLGVFLAVYTGVYLLFSFRKV